MRTGQGSSSGQVWGDGLGLGPGSPPLSATEGSFSWQEIASSIRGNGGLTGGHSPLAGLEADS